MGWMPDCQYRFVISDIEVSNTNNINQVLDGRAFCDSNRGGGWSSVKRSPTSALLVLAPKQARTPVVLNVQAIMIIKRELLTPSSISRSKQ